MKLFCFLHLRHLTNIINANVGLFDTFSRLTLHRFQQFFRYHRNCNVCVLLVSYFLLR